MTVPKRRKPEKLGLRQGPQIRSSGHLAWIRGHECSVRLQDGVNCTPRIEAAHVRTGTDGGLGVKPSDCWTIPLCSNHHGFQHQMGEAAFEKLHKIKMREIAQALWNKSPHRLKLTATAARGAREMRDERHA